MNQEIYNMSFQELRKECKKAGLKASGSREDLIGKLEQYYGQAEDEEVAPPQQEEEKAEDVIAAIEEEEENKDKARSKYAEKMEKSSYTEERGAVTLKDTGRRKITHCHGIRPRKVFETHGSWKECKQCGLPVKDSFTPTE